MVPSFYTCESIKRNEKNLSWVIGTFRNNEVPTMFYKISYSQKLSWASCLEISLACNVALVMFLSILLQHHSSYNIHQEGRVSDTF